MESTLKLAAGDRSRYIFSTWKYSILARSFHGLAPTRRKIHSFKSKWKVQIFPYCQVFVFNMKNDEGQIHTYNINIYLKSIGILLEIIRTIIVSIDLICM